MTKTAAGGNTTEVFSEYGPEDLEAQRQSRDAIMEIPTFPDLLTLLTRVFGPTAERDMLHQMIYWLSKRKLYHRWTIYKTYAEWKEERGLNRKQVDKGRPRLRSSGVVEEKYGPYKRIHYRINWVRLAEILTVPPLGASYNDCTPLRDSNRDCTPLRGDTPTQELTQELTSRTYLQKGRPTTKKKNSSKERPQTLDTQKESEVWLLLLGEEESDASRFADNHIKGKVDSSGEPFTKMRIAEKVRETLGGDEPLEAFMGPVERGLKVRRRRHREAVAS